MSDRVICLRDGAFQMDTGLFAQMRAQPDEASALLNVKELPSNVDVPVYAFVVETANGPLLIDAGGGSLMGAGFGGVAAGLRRAGFTPEMFTRVLLTHMHGDHCGGLLDARGRAAFPNARLAIAKDEIACWTDPDLPEQFRPIAADAKLVLEAYAGRINVVQPGEAMDGVEIIDAAGHTNGHIAFGFAEAGVIAAGDIVHVGAVQFARPEWDNDWDMDAAKARASRHRLIGLSKSRGADLLCAHAGRIRLAA
ncbi:MBL fold metallo-hydrolase [Pararhodobacter oceanensis]|uniref:MBL fold metallo-hydrolase n=1 Tax=Pararhodobacter oceanensis TaxID=2172121 RepID=UPI003A9215D5